MTKIPFAKLPKLRSVAVGNETTGILYLAERGGIAPAENPVDVQEEILKQQKIAKIYRNAESKLAKDRGVSLSEARKLLRASAKDQVVADPVDYEDLLTPEQIAELFSLQGSPKDFEIRVATLLIRHRVLYPVFLSAPAHPDIPALSVQPLAMELAAGSQLDFGKFKVMTSEYCEEGAEILRVKSLPGRLEAGEIGYLLAGGKYKLGCVAGIASSAEFERMVQLLESSGTERVKAEHQATEFCRKVESAFGWTDADTRQLDTALIHDIYRLYCREMGLPDPDLVPDEVEDEIDPLDLEGAETTLSLSSGETSTTESATSELVTA